MSEQVSLKIVDCAENKKFYFYWKSNPIPVNFAREIFKLVNKSRSYSPKMLDTVRQLVKSEEMAGSKLSLDVALNIQHIYIKSKIVNRYYQIATKAQVLSTEYINTPILNISKKYDFPPLLILKTVWETKMNYSEIKKIIKIGPDQAKSMLSDWDYKQLKQAYEFDTESMPNQQKAAEDARVAEKRFVEYFRNLGINLKDENDLINEQMSEFGRVSLTPDVLFTDEVFINDVPIKWMDFKNYACLDARFLLLNNIKQAKKYYEKWGMGALCYRYSFLADAHIDGAMLLDARCLAVNW